MPIVILEVLWYNIIREKEKPLNLKGMIDMTKKTMSIENMKQNIVNKFGLEHENTIKFFKICEFRYSKLIPVYYNKFINEEIEED